MLTTLFGPFVQQPLLILLVSAIFFGAYLLLRSSGTLHPRALLWPAIGWLVWAVWEYMLMLFSPDADIRVDLLVIIPVLIVLTIGGIVRLLWPRRS
jgi:hypothetical protein